MWCDEMDLLGRSCMWCDDVDLLGLQAAVVSPSDEDSQTFTVTAANGESFKLRGAMTVSVS